MSGLTPELAREGLTQAATIGICGVLATPVQQGDSGARDGPVNETVITLNDLGTIFLG